MGRAVQPAQALLAGRHAREQALPGGPGRHGRSSGHLGRTQRPGEAHRGAAVGLLPQGLS